MNLAEQTLKAQIKYMVLESAMMIQDGYTDQDVINRLMEIVELLDYLPQREVKLCNDEL
ncbi:hypothetical protein JOC86_002345 [Bacillus pakistanensis]|uniref:Phage protein n=1 Tax=Rossellomorea pakistanensis TaxID=992288 RepID=A0ABS2NDB0_9BACI|nr:hypothetical protein [Bacillus pakistanensis]MBM7585803.1 hypothetical protein [Bacillus pakistanensis]